jgi:hypothetical protein
MKSYNLKRANKKSSFGNLLILIFGAAFILQSCATTSGTDSKYFGYNNNPEREKEQEKSPDYTVTRVNRDNAAQQTTGQSGWVNPMAAQRSQADLDLEQEVTERERTVINNYYYYQPRSFVPVIRPWHTGYWGWASPRPGLTVSVGAGRFIAADPFYDPWHGWYNPWHDYHPFYGNRWGRTPRQVVWYNDPWVGRSNAWEDRRQPSTRRTTQGVSRSGSQDRYNNTRRGSTRSSVNPNNGTRRTTKYGNTRNSGNSDRNSNVRRGTQRQSPYGSSGRKYSQPKNSGSSKNKGGSVRRGSSRSGGGSKSSGSSSKSGSSRRGSKR